MIRKGLMIFKKLVTRDLHSQKMTDMKIQSNFVGYNLQINHDEVAYLIISIFIQSKTQFVNINYIS